MNSGCFVNKENEDNRLVVTRSFRKYGNEIYRENSIISSSFETHCRSCFKFSTKIKRCSSCKSNFYCCRKCMVTDWKKEHKNECRIFSLFLNKMNISKTIKILLRVITKNEINFFRDLKTNKENFNEEMLNVFETNSKLIFQILKDNGFIENVKEPNEIIDLFCKIKTNTFVLYDSNFCEYGNAIYRFSSYLNHSCYPNCFRTFKNDEIVVKALREIEGNEELTINYCDVISSRINRKKNLMDYWFFDCKCSRCLKERKKDKFLSLVISKKIDMNKIKDVDFRNKKEFMIYQEIYELLQKKFNFFHEKIYLASSGLLKLSLDLKEFDLALKYCGDVIKILKFYLTNTHPLTIHQHLIMAKLYLYKDNYFKCKEHYEIIKDNLETFFEEGTEVYDNFQNIKENLFSYNN